MFFSESQEAGAHQVVAREDGRYSRPLQQNACGFIPTLRGEISANDPFGLKRCAGFRERLTIPIQSINADWYCFRPSDTSDSFVLQLEKMASRKISPFIMVNLDKIGIYTFDLPIDNDDRYFCCA